MLENKKGPVTNIDMYKMDMDIIMLAPMMIGTGMVLWVIDYISKQISIGAEIDLALVILVISMAIFWWWFGWMGYTDYKAYFDYSEEGLGVKYLLQKRKVIPWGEFQQVCVCYTSYSTRGPATAHSVLCFVKKGEKKNVYGRWKASNPFRSRSVIAIEYTDELYEKVKKTLPI